MASGTHRSSSGRYYSHNYCCISQLGSKSVREQCEEQFFLNLLACYGCVCAERGCAAWSKVQTGWDTCKPVIQDKRTFTATKTWTAGWLQSRLTETLESFRNYLMQPNLSPHWAALNTSWETPQMLPVRGLKQGEEERFKKADKKYKSRQNKENPFRCFWRKSTQKREQPWLNLSSKGCGCVGWMSPFDLCILKHQNEQEKPKNRPMLSRA